MSLFVELEFIKICTRISSELNLIKRKFKLILNNI